MKILIVSWYFPPVNTIGALRVGKFARFLTERGHQVGVVAGKHWGQPETLTQEALSDRVAYANSVDVNAPPRLLRQGISRLLSRGTGSATVLPVTGAGTLCAPTRSGAARHRLSEFYVNLTNLPDNRIGWLPWAYRECRRMCQGWQPDLVFASGPPFTGLLVARRISARLGLSWVAELRDKWADDPYDSYDAVPAWRISINQWLERRVLSTAHGLVTVTEPLAHLYREKYSKPVATIYNGYDPLDFEFPTLAESALPGPLVIGYTGAIYPGRRDPTPLFQALLLLGKARDQFRVVFCGTNPAHVLPLAAGVGVQDLVEVRPAVPYKESLEFQRKSDLLLLLLWNDPRENGVCPGKLFEYLANLRPVLVIGIEEGVAATLVRQRSAGFCSNDPHKISAQLELWLREKQQFGRIQPLPTAAREGLSRTIQFERLETFLSEISQRSRPLS